MAIIPGNQYKVKSILGRGGIGVVYQVECQKANELWAVKSLHITKTENIGAIKQLEREKRSLAKLKYKNIVEIKSLKDNIKGRSKFPYIIMEYLDGHDLGLGKN
ncbi:MAG: protein kinase [Proteobacteria bacterium]|nr:protein kinase [Pseudomonadota bacterium]